MKAIILDYIREWNSANISNKDKPAKHTVSLKWNKPPAGFMKINVDGSLNSSGSIGAGGVLRDTDGNWCGGFMGNLGAGNIAQAEAWGVFYGLQMALRYGTQNIEVECDSTHTVNLLLHDDSSNHPLGTIISNCKSMSKNFTTCCIRHVHRESNSVADILAKASLVNAKGINWLNEAPPSVTNALIDDKNGVPKSRLITKVLPSPSFYDGSNTDDICAVMNEEASIIDTDGITEVLRQCRIHNNASRSTILRDHRARHMRGTGTREGRHEPDTRNGADDTAEMHRHGRQNAAPMSLQEQNENMEDQLDNIILDETVIDQMDNSNIAVVVSSPNTGIGIPNSDVLTKEGDITQGNSNFQPKIGRQSAPMYKGCLVSKHTPNG